MEKAKEEFLNRKKEIEKYFDFLSKIEHDTPVLHYSLTGVSDIHEIDKELQKILKANGFLLIYNLVEAVTRITLIEYLNSISKSNISIKKLHEDIQRLWVSNKRFADKKIGNKSEEMIFQELYNEIVSNTLVSFTTELKNDKGEVIKQFVKLSGNVDADVIRKLAKEYGFDSNVGKAEKAGADLVTIRTNRNYLAHGIKTFTECGGKFSVIDLCKYKKNALFYLESILSNIESHIKGEKYQVSKKKKK
jgi:hypothetical protein